MVKNPAFPHLFKIGRTTKKEVEERGLIMDQMFPKILKH
jgi:hypothetical protein